MGPYSYQIARTQDGISYSVTDGSRTLSSALAWVFGSGHFGQTYVYEQKGVFYESHLSYFQGIHGLDLTTGHGQMEIPDLDHSWGAAVSGYDPWLLWLPLNRIHHGRTF